MIDRNILRRLSGFDELSLRSLSTSITRSISQSNLPNDNNENNELTLLNNNNDNTNTNNANTTNTTTTNTDTTSNDISNIFPMLRSRFFFPLIIFILIKLIVSFLPKLLLYLLLYLYLHKTNIILREKLTLKGIKRITSLIQLLTTIIIVFTISITFMEYFFIEDDVSIIKRLTLYNNYKNINIISLFWYVLITDITICAITLVIKIFIFTILLLNSDMKVIMTSIKMCFANLRKLERKNSENMSFSKDKDDDNNSNIRRCIDDIESGIENNSIGRRRRTVSSSLSPDFVGNSSMESDSSQHDIEMKKENLQQIFLKKVASIIDLMSLIYRTIIVTPLWVSYLKLGSGGNFITSFYYLYKAADSIRKCCALYETVNHLIRGTIEFGHKSSVLEIESCEGCPICFEQIPDDPVTLSCNHTFCTSCIYEWLDRKQRNCPVCRANINSESTVLKALREDGILENMVLI